MATVRWTLDAHEDLPFIHEYFSQFATDVAARLSADLQTATERLASFPRLGRVVPEFEVEWLRELTHGDYRIMYEHRPELDEVWILAPYHAKRDVASLIAERWSHPS